MTLRPSMAALIDRTRLLISDNSAPLTFSDDQIQDALDLRRIERRLVPLQLMPTFQAGGAVLFLDYYANQGNWEDDYVLQDARYSDVTANPDVKEPVVGHWHFPSSPQGFAVHITGKTYDLYGSAADLLESWSAQVKLDFSVMTDRDTFARNQKFTMIRQLAADYRQRAQVQTSMADQSDAMPDRDGGGVVYPSYSSYGTI